MVNKIAEGMKNFNYPNLQKPGNAIPVAPPPKSSSGLLDNLENFALGIKNAFIGAKNAAIGGAAKIALEILLDTEADKKIIQSKIPQADSDRLLQQIQLEVPHLTALIQKILPSLDQYFQTQSDDTEDLLNRCLIHILANLAKQNGGSTAEEFIENCMFHLATILGPQFNEIDSEIADGTELSKDLFLPLADLLFDAIFFQDNIFSPFKNTIVNTMSEFLHKGYAPIATWLEGEKSGDASVDNFLYQDEIDHFAPLILEKVTDYYINKDRNFLNQLTGKDDFSKIIEKSAPSLCGQVLKKFDLPLDKMGLKGRKDLLEKAIEAAILRCAVNLSEELFENGMTPESFIQEVVSHFSKKLHFACNYAESQKQPVKVDHFYQASCNLAQIFLPKKMDWLNKFIERRQERLVKPVAEIHHSFYTALYNEGTIESYKERLRKVLTDPNRPDEDVGPRVDQLYNLCQNGMAFLKERGTEYFAKDGKVLILLNYLQEGNANALDDAVLQTLESGIQLIISEDDKDISWVGSTIKHWGATRLFQALICWFEKVPEDKRYPIDKLLFNAFELILQKAEDPLDLLTQSEEENPFAKESLEPVVKELIALFSEGDLNLKDEADLTLPEKIEKMCMEWIQNGCQSSLSKILVTITSWTRDPKASAEKLENLFQSKNMLRLCNLGKHVVTQGIPYYLNDKGDELTDKYIMPTLAPFLSETGEEAEANLEEYQALRTMIHGFWKEFGENDSPEKQKLIHFLGVFLETASVRLLGNVFERISAGDSKLEDLLTLGVEEAILHFTAIGDTKRAVKKSKPLRSELVQEFEKRKILHPALQGEDQKEAFYKKLADQVFIILDIDENSELPIPDWSKGFSFEMQEKMLPNILNEITKFLCDTGTINQILISILNHVIEDKAQEAPLLQRLFPDKKTRQAMMADLEPKFNDAYQTELQKKLAEAIEALIKMHPDRIPKLLMRSDKIKAYAGEAIGQPLREQIRDPESNTPISLLTIIDKVVGSYLNEIAPGKLDETTGEFTYYKTTLEGDVKKDDSGNPIETDAPNLSRFFPKTDKEKIKAKKLKAKQTKDAAKNVPKLLKHIIDHQTDQIAINAFIKKWAKLEKSLIDKMVAWFGDRYGKGISSVLLTLLRFFIKLPVGFGVLVFNYTIWLVASQILKLIFNKQAQKRAQDVGVDIHDNVVLRMTEKVVDQYAQALA